MRYKGKPIEGRSLQTAVDKQRVVMAHWSGRLVILRYSKNMVLPKAKLMTPIAWKMPGSMTENRLEGSPLSSGDVWGLSIRTDATIVTIPMRAKPDARESLCMSR